MKVSVIIPVLNGEKTIAKAIQSVLNQTVSIHEIVIADDASTDGTLNVVQETLAQPKKFWHYGLVTHIVQNQNKEEHWGICGGRNAALKSATGDAVLPLDCDDWIEPTYLEKTLPKLVGNVGIVSTHMRYFGDREGTIVRTWRRTYETQLRWNNIPVTSLVLKAALDKAGSYDHNLRGWEDWDMWLRILKLGYHHDFVNEVLFHYHLSEQGMNAWANRNQAHLIHYLTAKHPGFMEVRKTGATDEDGVYRKRWNDL